MTNLSSESAGLATLYAARDRFWRNVQKTDECWSWTGARTKAGYGILSIGNKHQYAHRLSWTYAYDAVPGSLHVLHRCDNPICVRPNHLFLGTDAENMADRIAKGRPHGRHLYPEKFPTGERVHTAKLTRNDVRQIRDVLAAKRATVLELSRQYGMSLSAIKAIRAGKTWKDAL